MKKASFILQNLHCASCVSVIENALKKYEGIYSAKVSLVASTIEVVWDTAILSKEDIIATITTLGYPTTYSEKSEIAQIKQMDKLAEHNLHVLSKKLIYFIIATIPLILISMGTMYLPKNMQNIRSVSILATLQLIFACPVILLSYKIYLSGFANLARKNPTMDTLIAIGTATAFIYSLWQSMSIFTGDMTAYHNLYFESSAVILTLVTLGEYLEKKAKYSASQALYALASLVPTTTTKICEDGSHETVSVSSLNIGDSIIVQQGKTIPIDATILDGVGSVNEAMLTGESVVVYKTTNDSVFAGTLLVEGTYTLHVTTEPVNTYLNKLISVVQEAQSTKAPIARIADIVSSYFVPIVLFIACTASLLWFFGTHDFPLAIQILISSLIIACPCAMGLATPISLVVGMGKATQLGIVIKSAVALEATAKVDTIFLDKTGTLTIGSPSVTAIHIMSTSTTEDEILDMISALTSYSTHPITQALAKKVEGVCSTYSTKDFSYTIGKGIDATLTKGILSYSIVLGSQRLLDAQNIQYDSTVVAEHVSAITTEGASPLFLAQDTLLIAIIAVRDTVRGDAKQTVQSLRAKGLDVIMLSGDIENTARAIAEDVGISTFYAGLLPEEKAQRIAEYKAKGHHTMMVGDGINDAIALSTADVGVAMGAGVDIAQEASSVVLITDALSGISTTIMLSRATIRNIKENLFWAFIYNIISIPIATGILYLFGGPLLSPMIAGFAMVFSSLSVLANALRLKLFKSTQ